MKIDSCYEDVSRLSVVGVLASNGRFELSKDVNLIPTPRRDLFGGVKIPKLMAVKKTYFPEIESSGSIVSAYKKSEKIGDSSQMVTSVPILEEQSK
ncbi:hypothetical protein Tco_0671700 [Tanacetum coccineum]